MVLDDGPVRSRKYNDGYALAAKILLVAKVLICSNEHIYAILLGC